MSFNCFLYSLRLNTDVPLSHSSRTMLQKPLNKGDVVTVIFVNLRRVPFTEAVSAYSVIAEVVTDDGELLLYGSFRDGENSLVAFDSIPQAVVLYVLRNHKGHCEHTALACLLFPYLQAEALTVFHNVARSELYNIADADSQIPFKHESRGDTLIGAAAAEALLHCLYYLFVLLCCQSLCSLVHVCLQQSEVRIIRRSSS